MLNYQNSTDLTKAIAGMTISVAYVANAPPQSYTYGTDPSTGQPIPTGGFLYNVFNMSGNIGGFNIKWVLTPPQGSVPDDIYLANITSHYDAVAKASFDTVTRRLQGLDFTPPLVDASLTLIINSAINQKPYKIQLSFLDPFGYDLWGGIVAAIACHALVQYILNRTKLIEDEQKLKNDSTFLEKMKIAESQLNRIKSKKRLQELREEKEGDNGDKGDNAAPKAQTGNLTRKKKLKALKRIDEEKEKNMKKNHQNAGDKDTVSVPQLPFIPRSIPRVDSTNTEEAKRRKMERDMRIANKKQIEYLVRQKMLEDKPEKKGFFDFFYYSYIQFSTVDDLEVEARSEKWLKLLFSFFLMIIVATYTANLATSLIATNTQNQLPIQSMAQANALRAKVCFRLGAAAIALTTAQYKGIRVVTSTTTSNIEVLQMLQRGECDAAVLANNDWQVAIETAASYKGWDGSPCNLQSIDIIRTMYVSLPYKMAHGDPYCTSFFGDVLAYTISRMQQPPSFLIDSFWSNSLATLQQNDCQDVLPAVPTSTQLSISSMAGLFVWYLVTTGIISLITIIFNVLDIDMEQHENDWKIWLLSFFMSKECMIRRKTYHERKSIAENPRSSILKPTTSISSDSSNPTDVVSPGDMTVTIDGVGSGGGGSGDIGIVVNDTTPLKDNTENI